MAAQQQKENYQRVLDQTIEQLTKEGKGADASPSQLLCALQQLCVGIPF